MGRGRGGGKDGSTELRSDWNNYFRGEQRYAVFLTDLKSAGFRCELIAVDVWKNETEDTYLLPVELFCCVVLVYSVFQRQVSVMHLICYRLTVV